MQCRSRVNSRPVSPTKDKHESLPSYRSASGDKDDDESIDDSDISAGTSLEDMTGGDGGDGDTDGEEETL